MKEWEMKEELKQLIINYASEHSQYTHGDATRSISKVPYLDEALSFISFSIDMSDIYNFYLENSVDYLNKARLPKAIIYPKYVRIVLDILHKLEMYLKKFGKEF